MSLQDCVSARGLAPQLQAGLQALASNSSRVSVTAPGKATHSIDLDAALKAAHPRDPRWDYGIGIAQGKAHRIAWVEVHPAMSSEVDAVLKKLAWLQNWFKQCPDACKTTPSTFHWVATGAGVHIDTARQRKLAAKGLKMPQSHLRV